MQGWGTRLNQPNAFLRLGWSFYGNATWGLMATKGQDVFRFAVGKLHVYPFYNLWSWQ